LDGFCFVSPDTAIPAGCAQPKFQLPKRKLNYKVVITDTVRPISRYYNKVKSSGQDPLAEQSSSKCAALWVHLRAGFGRPFSDGGLLS
jgi:hypothetical protein